MVEHNSLLSEIMHTTSNPAYGIIVHASQKVEFPVQREFLAHTDHILRRVLNLLIISWAKRKVTEVKEKIEGQREKGNKEKQAHTSDIQ